MKVFVSLPSNFTINTIMKTFLIGIFFIGFIQQAIGQDSTTTKIQKNLPAIEEELKQLGWDFNKNPDDNIRLEAAQQFKPKFKQALQMDNAFTYHFDSLQMISFLYPQDSTFRIITWQVFVNKDEYQYYGIIQKRDNPKHLIELKDRSQAMLVPSRKVLGVDNWYGAVYYNIKDIDTKEGKRYILFGFDAKGLYMRSKLLDVLAFKDGGVEFGMPIFEEKKVRLPKSKKEKIHVSTMMKHRFILDYSATSAISLNYDPELDAIIFDHLISMGGQYQGQGPTFVPDGSYESFQWNGEKFVHELKVYRQIQDRPVMEDRPILDNKKRKGKNVFGGK